MPLETIYVTRHGFRSNWSVDPVSGIYSATIPSPTGIPADPALTSHGVEQAKELAQRLVTLEPPIEAIYSSPYYRCLQTVNPFAELLQQTCHGPRKNDVGGSSEELTISPASRIRVEYGLSEWFGAAPFDHPQPASLDVLKSLFPACDETYETALAPSRKGETVAQIQQRVATAMQAIIDRCDAENKRSVVLCTHAAVVILLGRVLTGVVPDSVETDDFQAFTCGLSVYRRRKELHNDGRDRSKSHSRVSPVAVVGGWDCEVNSDCSFLSHGEERGWRFSGDESFPGTGNLSQETAEPKL